MEQIKQLVHQARGAISKASPQVLSRELSEGQTNEISIYTGDLTPNVIAEQMLKLTAVFPAVDDAFINVLSERIVANGFTNERLRDAVGHLIDNFKYPRPSIADVIGFDRRVRLFTHSEYCLEIHAKKAVDGDFCQHWINEKLFFVKKTDCERFNFKPNDKRN